MGQAKTFKKLRKNARNEISKVFKQFEADFNVYDLVKPCPKFIPQFIWNILIWVIIKHK